jgi:ABC-type glutathione transport system ATPase component
VLRKITETGQAVMLVEQNAHQSLRLADYVYVLENGRIHSSGTPAEIQEDEVIQQAYLGREHKPTVKPASAPAATPRAGGELHEGGFVNPFARTVFRDQGPVGPDEERSMVSDLQSVYSGGGFFNPYARSVAPRSIQATAPAAAASPEQAAPSAPKADASGGFYNPAARSIETKR